MESCNSKNVDRRAGRTKQQEIVLTETQRRTALVTSMAAALGASDSATGASSSKSESDAMNAAACADGTISFGRLLEAFAMRVDLDFDLAWHMWSVTSASIRIQKGDWRKKIEGKNTISVVYWFLDLKASFGYDRTWNENANYLFDVMFNYKDTRGLIESF